MGEGSRCHVMASLGGLRRPWMRSAAVSGWKRTLAGVGGELGAVMVIDGDV